MIADLVFVYHSVLMVGIQVYQCCIYKVLLWDTQHGKNKISRPAVMFVVVLWLIVITEVLIYWVKVKRCSSDGWNGMNIGIL